MPRRRMMDYLMGRPYGDMARSGRRMRRRMGGRDRAMDYGDMESRQYEDMAQNRRDYGDMARGSGNYGDRASRDYGDYETDMARGRRSGRDGHHPMSQGSTYYPIEAMGTFNGYWGMPEEDYARGGRGRRDYGYDYNYDMRGRDYGYDYGYDYGDSLTKEEMEHWRKKLDKEVGDEQSKNFFKKENIEQKARTLGIEMKEFGAEELALASYMLYSDYCKSLKPYVGQSMDVFVKMGAEFLNDPDSAVKGREKLAMYFDIVSGEDD